MAITAQELNVILSARDRQFTKAMDRAQRRVQGFAAKSQKELGKTTQGMNGLSRAAKRLIPILGAALSVRSAKSAQMVAVEIGRLSKIANASTTEFQKFAIAARTVGIEQDKVAGILKDVNDRVGDFLVTGGGPMKDFFEKVAPLVGVIADNFRNLSGPDALQLYVDTLQKAGASQQDFTFFMEAMASDATALLPLLKNNAAGLRSLGTEAERAGRIIEDDAVDAATKFQLRMDALDEKIQAEFLNSLMDLEDEIQTLKKFVEEYGIPAFDALVTGAAAAVKGIDALVLKFRELKGLDGKSDLFGSGDLAELEADLALAKQRRASLQATIKETFDKAGVSRFEDLGFFDRTALSNFSGYGSLQLVTRLNGEIEMLEILIANMKKEIEGKPNAGNPNQSLTVPNKAPPSVSSPLRIGITEGTLISNGDGLRITSDEDNQKAQDLRDAYQALLDQLMPLVEIEGAHAANLKTINEAVAAGLTDRETANMLIQQSTLEMRQAKDEMSGMATVADALEDGLTSAFMSALDGAQSFEDGIREMARDVIRQLYRVLVVQQMVNAAMGAFGYSPVPSGGFTRTGAGGRQLQSGTPYMTGESGRELFIPSTSGRLLSPVQTNRALSGGDTIEVSQTINVTTGVSQTVRAEIMSMMPQIAEMSKAAVLDAKQRGGAYGRAL